MPKTKQKFGSENQPSLLPGSLDMDHQVRACITAACKRQGRAAIAEAMSEALGRPVTERMLNDFTAESHEQHRFPLAWAAAFCEATRDYRLVELLVRGLGARVIGEEEERLIELGRAALQRESIDHEYQVRLHLARSERQG